MKISIQSLKWFNHQYGCSDNKELDDVDKLVVKIGAQLGEVEAVDRLGERYDNILVVNIVSCKKHPNADKLQVCKVDDGGVAKNVPRDADGYVQVVCGAPNCRQGLTVAWLPPGCTVPSTWNKEPFTLEARPLRGEISYGMLASPAELGISDNHDGLLEIAAQEVGLANTKPGTAFKQLFGLDDTIIEIENKMFTHRPDCFGMLGVARELAGINNRPFRSPDWYIEPRQLEAEPDPAVKGLTVSVEIPKLVPRYQALVMSGISVGPSPIWLQSFLTRIGAKPINNIVDMTNYLMYVTGQPLHAFDFDKVAREGKAEITVRNPKKGEKLSLLDGKTIEPRADAIVIANHQQAIALGGVMGGDNSEIDANTKRIIIESANFDMYNIRKTSMAHGLFTDAVTRFTKGQSPWQTAAVLHKAASMTKELSPDAHVVGKAVDVKKVLTKNPTVHVSAEFINERLGLSLKPIDIKKRLEQVEFSIEHHGDVLEVTAPFWRTDIHQPEDVVEEIGRLYGFDQLPLVLPQRSLLPAVPNPELAFKKRLRQLLSQAGANELLTYSFVHGNLLKKVGQDPNVAFELSNALSPDLQYYRLSLIPSLLDKVHPNIKAGYDQFALFEMNKTHLKLHKDDDPNDPGLPAEVAMLALVFSANQKAATQYHGAPFYQARAYLDYLANELGLPLSYQPFTAEPPYPVMKPYDWRRSALVTVTGTKVILGAVGEFRPDVKRALKLPPFTAGFEVGLNELQEALTITGGSHYLPLAKYPRVTQDLSFKVANSVSYAALANLLQDNLLKAASQNGYMHQLEALDIYQPTAKTAATATTKHITFRLKLWHEERTLTTREVNNLLDELAKKAQNKLQAERI